MSMKNFLMKESKLYTYFLRGSRFLREHPQLWLTALTGVSIVVAFLFVAWKFATIAQDAQEQLTHVRTSYILDTFTVLAPSVLEDADRTRTHMREIRSSNPTVLSFVIYALHDSDSWRVYVSENGPKEGAIIRTAPFLFGLAWADPSHAYTSEFERGNERLFVTARAIRGVSGAPIALAVTEQTMSEADKQITENIQSGMYVLLAVLSVITLLFLRHARIVDFAVLYRKQLEIDEMKDSFIGMASHELKSPLTVIRGYIELLKDSATDESVRQEYLRRIDVSALELKQLIDDILDVSRIEMGRLRFSPDHVRVKDVLDEVAEMFAPQASEKGIVFRTDMPEAVTELMLRLDRGRFKQVLVNLVSNAVKYTLAGEIVIGVSTDASTAEIFVLDSGVGMTDEEREKLFKKFYRAEATECKGVSGTGLGLWISKYIVEHMRGSISVESVKGKGSRFVLKFPLYEKSGITGKAM